MQFRSQKRHFQYLSPRRQHRTMLLHRLIYQTRQEPFSWSSVDQTSLVPSGHRGDYGG